jgi:hypothetical protein
VLLLNHAALTRGAHTILQTRQALHTVQMNPARCIHLLVLLAANETDAQLLLGRDRPPVACREL